QTSLTRTSSRPCSASMRRTSAATCAGSRWSTRTAIPSPPAAVTSSAVSSMVSGRSISDRCDRVDRPVTYTVAPAAPSSAAMPRPAPRVPPATRATVPFSALMGTMLAPKPDGSCQVSRRRPRAARSGEDAHAAGADEEADDDQDDAPQQVAAGDDHIDSGDHQYYGDEPQDCHHGPSSPR